MNLPRTPVMAAMLLSFLFCSMFLVNNLLSPSLPSQQQPLIHIGQGKNARTIDLIDELKKAEIIPTVIDTFHPLLTISITWNNASAEYGNSINPSLTQSEPNIRFLDTLPESSSSMAKHAQLTLAMTDPDAPSRENPEWSEICHWITTSISLQDANANDVNPASKMEDVMPYKPPGPPPKTGKHRYVFVALAPLNGTTEALHLVKPGDRQHWGYEGERVGLRKWAEEMGLGVVGANFIYEQNDEQ